MRTTLERGAVTLCALASCLLSADASAHAVAGNRVFPATMAVDDPGVGDELNLEFGHLRSSTDDGDKQNTNTTTLEWDKRITPSFQLSVTGTYVNLNAPNGGSARGFDNWQVGAKYRFYVNEKHEFMASVGASAELGGTGAHSIADPHSAITPTLYFGKGFGDLPDSLKYLKPLAITGTVGPRLTLNSADPNALSWGVTVQYSLPYLQNFVQDVGLKAPFSNLIPVVEFPMSTCTASPCSGHTTGTINPGLMWGNRWGQFGVEAQIPVNHASGTGVGVLLQAHLFLDDVLPNSLGKPIFGKGE
ncbi:hypothetical protein [Burkholderia ubonensis]|uniref:hypothetical protein n=1 Tax=Burkholderia ubonensis TaxID=101571 RepID=UPI00075538E2|nr:hypothetical protein [Burkholderia ubonensis]KVO72928.1 hypothetical protein WJ78_05505 [Burkholderia ubonensis]KVP35566.1 hypothetical protein WJ87_13740 [Burkholderia ubonensis]KVP52232.1 hypothetical protein WJ88_15130 [Burkholderia ubonensis]KVQ34261.1 hypothetical protein WK00_18425 [Burkholderia ubonensis]KVX11363.1 hypothetical protein WL03_24790 [Burkholderia ubonensis]